jgi:toxin YoeB
MELILDHKFLEQVGYWAEHDRKVLIRIFNLLQEIRRDPFRGTAKPEPLKGLGAGMWSRRITAEHRLVYRVEAGRVYLLQCRFHY